MLGFGVKNSVIEGVTPLPRSTHPEFRPYHLLTFFLFLPKCPQKACISTQRLAPRLTLPNCVRVAASKRSKPFPASFRLSIRHPGLCPHYSLQSLSTFLTRFLPTAIHEYDAKLLLAYWLERAPPVSETATVSPNFVYPAPKVAQISWDAETGAITAETQLPAWVFTSKLVAKPDQLIKRRGKSGLLLLNKEWEQAKEWILARAGKEVQVSSLSRSIYLVTCQSHLPSMGRHWCT